MRVTWLTYPSISANNPGHRRLYTLEEVAASRRALARKSREAGAQVLLVGICVASKLWLATHSAVCALMKLWPARWKLPWCHLFAGVGKTWRRLRGKWHSSRGEESEAAAGKCVAGVGTFIERYMRDKKASL